MQETESEWEGEERLWGFVILPEDVASVIWWSYSMKQIRWRQWWFIESWNKKLIYCRVDRVPLLKVLELEDLRAYFRKQANMDKLNSRTTGRGQNPVGPLEMLVQLCERISQLCFCVFFHQALFSGNITRQIYPSEYNLSACSSAPGPKTPKADCHSMQRTEEKAQEAEVGVWGRLWHSPQFFHLSFTTKKVEQWLCVPTCEHLPFERNIYLARKS